MLFSDRLHVESPVLKQAVKRVMAGYTGRVAGLIRTGVAAGCFAPDLDSEESARYVVAVVQGLIMRWSIFDFSFRLEDEADRLWGFIHAALVGRR